MPGKVRATLALQEEHEPMGLAKVGPGRVHRRAL